MADNVTIARPYAKAVFNHAVAQNQLSSWSVVLHDLAQLVLDPVANAFICNPASKIEQQSQLLRCVTAQAKDQSLPLVDNFIQLLATNKRLLLLPDIYLQFEKLRAEQEKTVRVEVNSFTPLTEEQRSQLVKSLSQRLQRHVMLDVSIDASLLGGAVIRAGDLVIDGSLRGKLIKLGTDLAA